MTSPALASLNASLPWRRTIFIVALAGLGGLIEGATIWCERTSVGGPATPWQSQALLLAPVAAVLVSGLAGLMGRYLFFLPLVRVQAALSQSEQLYRLLVDASADLVIKIGTGRPEPVVGGAIDALLGYEAGDMPLAAPLATLHPDDREDARRQLRSLSATAPRAEMTVRLQHKAGHYLWVDITLHHLDQGSGPHETLVTIRDITARRREAEELRAATLAAQTAQAEADRANAAKTDFLACMSHEIRTPLNSVIGFAGLMLDHKDASAQVRLYAERIKASGNALLTVVDDILDFSQVEAGALELHTAPFSLPTLLDECISIVQHAATTKHLSVHVTLHDRLRGVVQGDAARLRQILLNLLNNAIKFTNEGSVLLDLRRDRSTGDPNRITFSVIDTGIGIAREDLTRLFHRFRQVDGSIRRTYGGTGLGLAISKKLVDLMGGTISVDSEKGVGSTFAFTIALPPGALVQDDARHRSSIAVSPCRILLAEDVPINQDLVRHILESSGHVVDIVGNGAEAVMAVLDMDYDIVLMDLQMPYMDGLSATRIIRGLKHHCRNVPIVAMTANVLPEQTELARAAGMVDVIHKPFSAAQIFATLERVVGGGARAADASSTPEANEIPVLAKLTGLLGDAKVKALLAGLAESLTNKFEADPSTEEGREVLRRQAHASVAGSGMLGFLGFAATCKAFEVAADEAGFADRLAALKREAREVIAAAAAMAAGTLPLAA